MSTNSASKIYKKEFKRHFKNHEGNFPPSRKIVLGDFGIIEGGDFKNQGNIANLGVVFSKKKTAPSAQKFSSSGAVSVKAKNSVDVEVDGGPSIDASVELEFSKKNAIFFSSAEVRYLEMDNLSSVGEQIKALYEAEKWDKNYVVVTRIVQGKNTVIAISGSAGANAHIQAKASGVRTIDLANAGLKLKFSSHKNLSYQIAFDGNCQIGYYLSSLKNRNPFLSKLPAISPTIYSILSGKRGKYDHLIFAQVKEPGSTKVYYTADKLQEMANERAALEKAEKTSKRAGKKVSVKRAAAKRPK